MNYIPRPLVQPQPTTKVYGECLARLIATMRKHCKEPKATALRKLHNAMEQRGMVRGNF